jgi:hypothetical protein
MNRRERKTLTQLQIAYREIARYDEDSVNADILLAYFKETVTKHGVDFTPIPVICNDEVVSYEPPNGYFDIQDRILRIVSEYHPSIQHDECQRELDKYFTWFCKRFFTEKKIVFFADGTLRSILYAGEIRETWRRKFQNFNREKEAFFALPIVRSTLPQIEDEKRTIAREMERRKKDDSKMKFAYAAVYQMFFILGLLVLSMAYFALAGTEVFSIPFAPEIVAALMGMVALACYRMIERIACKIAFKITKVLPYDSFVLSRGEAAIVALITCILLLVCCAFHVKQLPDLLSFVLFLAALAIAIYQQMVKEEDTLKSKWVKLWKNVKGVSAYILFTIGNILLHIIVTENQNVWQVVWTVICVSAVFLDCARWIVPQKKGNRKETYK